MFQLTLFYLSDMFEMFIVHVSKLLQKLWDHSTVPGKFKI